MGNSSPRQALNSLGKDIDILQNLLGTSFDPFVYYGKGMFVKKKGEIFNSGKKVSNPVTCSEGNLLFVHTW
jgi:hypothetical protein